jgi:hypothetical protein
MDNKKLLRILLRDAGELEQLIGEIRQAGSFDPLDMELLQTRISGIKHLLEVAADFKEALPKTIDSDEKPAPLLDSLTVVKIEPVPVLQPDVPKKNKEKKKETVVPVAERPPLEVQPVSFSGPTVLDVIIQSEPAVLSRATLSVEENINPSEEHILAEKFVAGKSLNDILQEKSKTEPDKLSNLPLKSLATGIGTNERFLFTRELFDGNMDLFNETVRKLDTLGTIQEAIAFLSENFTWGKNETSLRFIDLIKRRFIR